MVAGVGQGEAAEVVVVGGGIAGLSAAVALADAGLRVTVLERRSVLGGRAASFSGQGQAEPVDNCQHVLLRCCTCLLDFYRRIGVSELIAFHPRITFIDGRGSHSTLTPSPLPAPLHLGPAFLRLRCLGLRDKWAIARGMLKVLRADPGDPALGTMTMEAWLLRARQTPRALEAFWAPVLVSALNETLDRASARYGLKVFREGFLATRHAYEMGVPSVPLHRLYEEPCESYVGKRGGEIRRGTPVSGLLLEENRLTGLLLSDGTELHPTAVVSAVPSDALLKLLPAKSAERHLELRRLRELRVSPITAVHLWFDRNVTDLDHAVLLDGRLQWMFNKTRNFGLENGGSYLGFVVSASREWSGWTRDQILEAALREVHEAFPKSREASLTGAKVVVEPRATFSPAPGCDGLRPGPRSPIPGLYLAGDWTDTGWPGTMEGAVRSGYRAAEALLADRGQPRRYLVPDIASTGLSALLLKRPQPPSARGGSERPTAEAVGGL